MASPSIRALFETVCRWHPLRLVALGYLGYILITWVLLCLPVSWQADHIGALDNLFIATSAVSTTGLITVNTPDAYNFFGEFIILLAFQVGGLGYMTLGSFAILLRKQELTELRTRMGRVVFTLPEGFSLPVFLRHVVIFAIAIEIAGAIGLFFAFGNAGVSDPLWPAIFHAVSAFCTAGFSVFPDSLEGFRGDFWVNAIVSMLSILGSIGFLVVSDAWLTLFGRRTRMTLTSRIILHFTFWAILIGWALLFLIDPSLRQLKTEERLLASGFQSMTALTTVGFNTHPIGALHVAAVLVVIVLMIMGASPSGTGGGLKSTSVSAGFAVLWSVVRGRDRITFWGREVPNHRLFVAFAASVFYLLIFIIGSMLLLLVQPEPFEDVLFEAASGLGTVGLSRGITGDLVPLGKVIVIVLMFLGRVGPLTFALAIFAHTPEIEPRREDIAV